MGIRKTTRDIVGSAVGLGVGGSVLGGLAPSMPTGTSGPLISKTIGTGGRMLGVVTPVAFGFGILKQVDKGSKRLRRKR